MRQSNELNRWYCFDCYVNLFLYAKFRQKKSKVELHIKSKIFFFWVGLSFFWMLYRRCTYKKTKKKSWYWNQYKILVFISFKIIRIPCSRKQTWIHLLDYHLSRQSNNWFKRRILNYVYILYLVSMMLKSLHRCHYIYLLSLLNTKWRGTLKLYQFFVFRG